VAQEWLVVADGAGNLWESIGHRTAMNLTLEQFHELLSDSYAVCANDTLYFVGYNTEDDTPYIADNDGEDYVDLSTVDGEIEVHPNYVFFHVQGEPIQMVFLHMKKLM